MAKVMLISSAGGHLTEVLTVASDLAGQHEFVGCVTDFKVVRGIRLPELARLHRFPVLLNYSMPLGVIVSLVASLGRFYRVFRRERPDYLVTTGAEIALPALLVNKLFFRKPTLYIESLARIDSPSLTGRLAARLVDKVFVQWPGVERFYPDKGEYHGRLI